MKEKVRLLFQGNENGTQGICLTAGRDCTYGNSFPAVLEIRELSGGHCCFEAGYETIMEQENGYLCTATVETKNGSQFCFQDTYCYGEDGESFRFFRAVTVLHADSRDAGFSSRFRLAEEGGHTLSEYDIFIPGIWYRKNNNVVANGFGSDKSDRDFYIRATRMALPYVQLYREATQNYLSIYHLGPEPSTGIKEETADWLVDASLQYPSLGLGTVPDTSVEYLFPGSEGEKNYIEPAKGWARRSHPLTGNPVHQYELLIHVGSAPDDYTCMKREWRYYFGLASPKCVAADLEKNYQIGVELLNTYCQEYNKVMGLPFWATVPEGTVCDISFQMGFVGQQLQCACHLMKYGAEHNISPMVEKAKQLIDFWATKSTESSVVPRVWYNAFPASFKEDYPTYTRTVADGMEGMLLACELAKRYGIEHKEWLEFCISYGDWLTKNQNSDGSFYRSYDDKGAPVHMGKFNTTNVIRFLVNLYWKTGEEAYLLTAKQAGAFSYETVYKPMQYVGGTADNDNTIDKEAGMIAVYAFMSLYDATGEDKWLDAAKGAADFCETWTYAWTFPVKPHKGNAVFDKVDFTGLSLIATGHSHADVMMAYMVFEYYRLHLFTKDSHYYEFARFLSGNTKQTTDWEGKLGHAYPGLLEESGELALQYHNGLGRWLPWCTIAEIEPLMRLKEWFGSMDVAEIEAKDKEENERNNHPEGSSWIRT